MNKIYNSLISFFPSLLLVVVITSWSNSFAFSKNETDPLTIVPMATNYTLKWNKHNNSALVILVSENKTLITPSTFEETNSAAEYMKGANMNGAFAVYKETNDQIEMTGLKAGTSYYVWFYETDAAGRLQNITDKIILKKNDTAPHQKRSELLAETNSSEPLIAPTVEKPGPGAGPNSSAFTTVCAPVSGITCTLSGTTSSGYIAGSAPCNANPFGTVNPWDGGSCSGYIAYSFSSPVKSVIIKMIAVNSIVDKTTITQAGGTGGALTVSSPVCMNFAGLVLGPYTGPGSYGDVAAKVTSVGTYTTLTCTNSGCNSGWVAACPSFISTLPIELISFTGECSVENVVDLKWRTISEKNNDFFTIERSSNIRDWDAIGKIKGAGNSTQITDYDFTDRQHFNETMYYRMKQTDYNGEFKYSDPIGVSNCKLVASNINEVSIYPNPTAGDLTVNSNSDATVLEIYNTLGVLVGKRNLSLGENKLDISDLSGGTYYIKISDATAASKMTKLIVNPK